MADAALRHSDADRDDPFRALERRTPPTRRELAVADLASGVARAWLPATMAWQDIRQRYRRSVLGPFWLTISMAVMIVTLGLLYSSLFNLPLDKYLPYLTLGLLFWTFISTVTNEGCACFIEAEAIVRQIRMPYFTHVYRTVFRNLIILAHNAVVYVAVQIYFQLPLSAYSLLLVPGLVILVLNSIWVCVLLGMICARFRDVIPIVATLVQIWFFGTPILWDSASLGGRHVWLVEFNPVSAIMQLVRAPLLGEPIATGQWLLALGTTIVGCAAAFA